MYDQEKIKKMKNHELAMEAYYYALNNYLFGGATKKTQSNVLNISLRLWIQMKESIFDS